MNDRIKEAALVLEHHRALFRLKNSKTPEDRLVFGEQVKQSQQRLNNYLARVKAQQSKGR